MFLWDRNVKTFRLVHMYCLRSLCSKIDSIASWRYVHACPLPSQGEAQGEQVARRG